MSASITRLFDFPHHYQNKFPDKKMYNYKEEGSWKSINIKEFLEQVNAISNALISIGVKPNDNIAIVTHVNCIEWHVLDIALLQIGAVSVPLYPTLSEKDFKYVLNHSESKFCFASNEDLHSKIAKLKDETLVTHLFSFEEKVSDKNLKYLLKLGKENDFSEEITKRKEEVKPDQLATIVYTSGTTGTPKGAMISHKNMVSASILSSSLLPFDDKEHRTISYLPINHIFERLSSYLYMYLGTEVYFAESIEKLGENLKEVKPTFFPVVPRLVEKIYDKIIAKGQELTGVKKGLFFWATKLAGKYSLTGKMPFWYQVQHKLADKLIYSKWREVFGGEVHFMVSGSAPLQGSLIKTFTAAGLPICEGYGMTECSGITSVNDFRDNKVKVSTVGIPPKEISVIIAKDGEILMKGDNVFLGYYKDEEKTKETLINGYLHTGDIGEITDDGFLAITDRKKEMFKTSGGKYIAPAIIENQMKQSRFIEQITVVGEGKRMPAALIQVNYEFVDEWAKAKNISINDYATNTILNDRVEQEITRYNQYLGKWEQIKKFKITPEAWTIEDGHLTPTLKPKRKVIKQKYKDLIEKMYEY